MVIFNSYVTLREGTLFQNFKVGSLEDISNIRLISGSWGLLQ